MLFSFCLFEVRSVLKGKVGGVYVGEMGTGKELGGV